jgi:Ca-activated chloride channel homolog
MKNIIARLVIPLALVFVCAAPLHAGRIYARQHETASPLYNLTMKSNHTTVTIRNLLAITHVDEEFLNKEPIDLEGFYVFQLPEGAVVDGLWMWVDGVRYTFNVKRIEDAKHEYDSLVNHNVGEPAILQSLGANRFQMRIYPIKAGSLRRIELQYFQVISINNFGVAQYYYPLDLTGYQTEAVKLTDMHIRINPDLAVDSIWTNYNDRPLVISTAQTDTNVVDIVMKAEDIPYDKDLIVQFRIPGWFGDFPRLNYTPPDTVDSGYFIMWDPIRLDTSFVIKADYVFAVDASASMTGLRTTATLDALGRILSKLQPFDRFRLIAFNGAAQSYPPDSSMLFASPANVQLAVTAMAQMYRAIGITNYEQAIKLAQKSAFRKDAAHRFIFYTDGLPNYGAHTDDDLIALFRNPEAPDLQFFPIAMFTEMVDTLYNVAAATNGLLTAIDIGADVFSVMDRVAFDFTRSNLRSVQRSFPSVMTLVLPDTIPSVLPPESVVSAGLFPVTGFYDVSVQCFDVLLGMQHIVRRTITLQMDTTQPVEIARFWASLRIKQLLGTMKNNKDSAQIRESIIRLSERFNILSPYTAFLVVKIIDGGGHNNEAQGVITESFRLKANYPNPFASSTILEFYIPSSGYKSSEPLLVTVFDALGHKVATLCNVHFQPGWQRLVWNGKDDSGHELPAGNYYCTVKYGAVTRTILMTIAR